MRYHYRPQHPFERCSPLELKMMHYGETYLCSHPVYSRCTLYKIGEKGLAVIQQRKSPGLGTILTYWTEIDEDLRPVIYLNTRFPEYFYKYAKTADKDGLYPTVTLRQIMWALRLKPLKKERWETTFDHCPV